MMKKATKNRMLYLLVSLAAMAVDLFGIHLLGMIKDNQDIPVGATAVCIFCFAFNLCFVAALVFKVWSQGADEADEDMAPEMLGSETELWLTGCLFEEWLPMIGAKPDFAQGQ